jgi:hypothetical protein
MILDEATWLRINPAILKYSKPIDKKDRKLPPSRTPLSRPPSRHSARGGGEEESEEEEGNAIFPSFK